MNKPFTKPCTCHRDCQQDTIGHPGDGYHCAGLVELRLSKPTTVWLTFKNADMTEGRGPMIPDLCFTTKQLADEYIDLQPGCMGRRGKWSTESYGDWQVKPVQVFDSLSSANAVLAEALRAAALKKLSRDERRALGLE